MNRPATLIGLMGLSLMSLTACNTSVKFDGIDEPELPQRITIDTNFKDGEQGWVAGFSDYPIADSEIYELVAEIAPLPNDESVSGFRVSGHNRSDDLFMYLKLKADNLAPNTRYILSGTVTFLSNAGRNCTGIGGAPGESVFFKLGASELEPEQVDYYMNVDKGNQSTSGNDALTIGNVATDGASCTDETTFDEKTLELEASESFEIQSSEDGHLWLFFGTDSGFEGLTNLYYTNVALSLTPSD
ncbi:MAG: hypothetical protein ACFHVJ_07980 [Aestuariibacter sp.]